MLKVGHSFLQKAASLFFLTTKPRLLALILKSLKWYKNRDKGVVWVCPMASTQRSKFRRRANRRTKDKALSPAWEDRLSLHDFVSLSLGGESKPLHAARGRLPSPVVRGVRSDRPDSLQATVLRVECRDTETEDKYSDTYGRVLTQRFGGPGGLGDPR